MAKRPPRNTPIRTSPVSLNESTLETNIASEIATLFNSHFNFGYPFRLRWLFEFDIINLAAFKKRKTKLYRLTPIEENRGGGWDTKISIPKGNNDSRAIFIQFKSGDHSDGNNIPGSIFNLNIRTPNPNAEFTFNDNTSKNPASSNNQHKTLKTLSDYMVKNGFSSKSVMYGFPRITRLKDFEKLEDDLILHTTFLTIDEMDAEAKKANANLYDGKTHNFRTCYISENRREISSDTFELHNSNEFEDVLYEIILVKLAHFRNQFSKDIPSKNLNNELFLMLAEYLKINPFKNISLYDNYRHPFKDEIRNYFKGLVTERESNFYGIFERNDSDDDPFAWRERLYNRIVEFFESKQEQIINIPLEIPSKFTFNLNNEKEIEFDLKSGHNLSLLVF
jgi:hypothetical protein